jgi:hypothetical protein
MELVVNKITEENNVIHGIAVFNDIVLENFEKTFGKEKAKNLKILVDKNIQDFYLIERFFQFVGFLQFQRNIGLSLKLSDFKNNIDNVLDEYLELESKNWSLAERNKYAQIFDEILSDPNLEKAELINRGI